MADKSFQNYTERHIVWYGHSAFKITAESGAVLYIDPFRLPSGTGEADVILISHEHYDHYDPQLIKGLRKSRSTVIVPRGMAYDGLQGMKLGETVQAGPFRVTGIPAYNINKNFHPQVQYWLGYLIEVDGVRIFHAGDSDNIPEWKGMKPDIALLPVGGTYTMDVAEAAKAVAALGAELAIPMHYGSIVGVKEDGVHFAALLKPGQGLVLTPHCPVKN
ncbi:MAG TPA: MBL fold metallo-hydrolase [Bacillota bacterium]